MVENVSHHPDQVNIFDGCGCNTKTGQRCRACCRMFKVAEVDKPAGVQCRFDDGNGCGIHDLPEQPEICREYHCSQEMETLTDPAIDEYIVRLVACYRITKLLQVACDDEIISEAERVERTNYWEGVRKNGGFNTWKVTPQSVQK